MKVTVSRKAHFNAAHRLYRKDFTDTQNNEIFGKCANPHYHGHNYELIVHVKGEVDPITGYVIDMKTLKNIKLRPYHFKIYLKNTMRLMKFNFYQ